ncbi:site-2 protease family protein [Synechococcus elongatus]|uniref:Site-2 protease family protein n=1 Tax=Synechococcus elongatus PCC 11801 TaxID=2219813 RepID=A0AAN1QMA2_SYNEL|nr:site-2 protease family protein [Synechococcus elongatus]AZB71762.1 site-2 protease family protein [Synechococcus elongatus PCC 11801]
MLFLLLWLVLLAVGSYWMLQRSVPRLSRTPVWLLWLVLMMPALVWIGWGLLLGQQGGQLPFVVFLLPLLLSSLLYWTLLQWGRLPPSRAISPSQEEATAIAATTEALTAASTAPTRSLTAEEEALVRQCFPFDRFNLQRLEYRYQAVICRGNLRGDPALVYEQVRTALQQQFGDRFLLMLREDNAGKPFFALIPNPLRQQPRLALKPGLAIVLLGLTLLTTTVVGFVLSYAGQLTEIQPQLAQSLEENPAALLRGLPYALSLLAILGVHEFGHFWAARQHRLQASLPYFIPVPAFLGTFGAFVRIRSPIPDRKALFDVGVSGPLAGLVITLPLLIWGLTQSQVVPMPERSGLLSFSALDPGVSILMGIVSHLSLGDRLDVGQALQLHPVAIAGYLGLIVTALNLIPVGQLDGGHIVHAMFGQRQGAVIGQVARLCVLALSFVRSELLLWALLLLLLPVADEPALNDLSELDDRRDGIGFFALLMLILIVLPLPPVLQQWLTAL